MFSFPCRRCGSMLSGDTNAAGSIGMCPTCGGEVTVPRIDPRTGIPVLTSQIAHHDTHEGTLHAYAAAGAQAPQIVQSENGDSLIACPNCGRHSDLTADRCTHCRHPFTLEGVTTIAGQAFVSDQTISILLGAAALLTIWCGIGAIPGLIGIAHGVLTIRHAHALPATPTLWGCYLGIAFSAGALVAGVVFLLR